MHGKYDGECQPYGKLHVKTILPNCRCLHKNHHRYRNESTIPGQIPAKPFLGDVRSEFLAQISEPRLKTAFNRFIGGKPTQHFHGFKRFLHCEV